MSSNWRELFKDNPVMTQAMQTEELYQAFRDRLIHEMRVAHENMFTHTSIGKDDLLALYVPPRCNPREMSFESPFDDLEAIE